MKPVILIQRSSPLLILLWILTRHLFAQSGVAKSLEVGNKWIYTRIDFYSGKRYYEYELVTKHTVFAGKAYAEVWHGTEFSLFERADSNRIYRYNIYHGSESTLFDFRAEVGDSLGYCKVSRKYSKEFWGKERRFIQLSCHFQMSESGELYAEGIGLVSRYHDAHGVWPSGEDLAGAVLNGVAYGDTTLPSSPLPPALPQQFNLAQNYPNPFHQNTELTFDLPKETQVRLVIFNVKGQQVRVLFDEFLPAGNHRVTWDGTDEGGRELPSGIYVYQMTVGEFRAARKLLLY